MSSAAVAYVPSTPASLEAHADPVADAEAMADRHLARREEVERVGQVVRVLDDLVRVPGTKFGIGLDAIVGFFVPVVGDAITAAVGMGVVATAVRRGVPRVVIARMVLNLVVDLVVGMLPVVGDAFDVLWRANTRNLALLERHQDELEPVARKRDYLVVAAAGATVAAAVALPFVLLWLLLGALL